MPTHEKSAQFFKQFEQKVYKKGEILIRAGENPTGIYYVLSGTIKQYALSKKGEVVTINIFKPGSFFPMSWAINNTANVYFFETEDTVVLHKAPKERALEFIKHEPDVLYDLLSRTYYGTDGLQQRLTYLMTGSARERLITEIIIYAKRFGNREKTDKIICTVTEKDLAAATGMARETISREIGLLKQQGILDFTPGNLVIPDISLLENELS